MKPLNKYLCLCVAGGLALSTNAIGSELTTDNPHFGERGWDFRAGIGIIADSDTIYDFEDDDQETGVYLPIELTWYGENLYLVAGQNELLLGYTLAKNSVWALDAIVGPRGGGPDTDDLNDSFGDVEERDTDLQAGLRYSRYGDGNRFRMELTGDISDTHDGYIATGSYQQEWQVKNWVLTGGVALAYISEDMTGYFFDVSSSEATPGLPVYTAAASTLAAFSLSADYPINEKWVFNTEVSHLLLDDEISDSPLSTGEDSISTVSAAVIYHF